MCAHGVLAADCPVAPAEEAGGVADAAIAVRDARQGDHARRGGGHQARLQQASQHVGPQIIDLQLPSQEESVSLAGTRRCYRSERLQRGPEALTCTRLGTPASVAPSGR